MSMLEVKDLQVYYGVIQALKGISFEVEQGDVVALIGANGAGKTTTLHTITGLLPSKAGNITFEGTDITHVPVSYTHLDVYKRQELDRSIRDLTKYIPAMQSVSVVPVGLSKYRDGLYPLEPFTPEQLGDTIDLIEKWQKKIYAEHGIHFIHASDEFYMGAGRPLPEEMCIRDRPNTLEILLEIGKTRPVIFSSNCEDMISPEELDLSLIHIYHAGNAVSADTDACALCRV